jgi:hypothetical protein
MIPSRRSPFSAKRSGPFVYLALLLAAAIVALGLGLVTAFFPPSFLAKLAAALLAIVVFLFALISTDRQESADAGNFARRLINLWAVLLGACPAYLPFKFGPLPGLNPLRLCFGAIFLTWLCGLVMSSQLRKSLSKNFSHSRWTALAFMTLFAWQLVCAMLGDEAAFSLYYTLKSIATANIMFLVAMTFFRSWADIRRTMVYLMLGSLISCVAALVEWKLQSNIFLNYLPVDRDQLADMDWILADKSRGGEYRVSGTFSHPLALAEYLCMLLPIILTLAWKSLSRIARWTAALLIPVLLVVVYSSHTRSSVVAVASSLLVLAILFGIRAARQRKRAGLAMLGWMTIVTTLSCAAAFSAGVGYLAQGRTSEEAGSSRARIWMVQRGIALLEDRPIQGYGPGLAALKIGPAPGQRNLTIDSYFLSVALESGYVGLLLFSVGIVAVLSRTLAVALRTQDANYWIIIAIAMGIVSSLTIKIILSLTNNLDLLYFFIGISMVAMAMLEKSADGVTRR